MVSGDKHHIPKGKLNTFHTPLPQHIKDKIQIRNNTRKQNPKDPNIQKLNNEINKLICIDNSETWKTKIEGNYNHKTNTHKLWQLINSLSGKTPKQEPNRAVTFDHKPTYSSKQIASNFNKQFTTIVKHKTNISYRKTDKTVKALPNTNLNTDLLLITEQQVKKAIQDSKTNKSTGPDNINIQHLKHLGPKAISLLTDTYNQAILINSIPASWKLAKIIPIPKPNKKPNEGTSYRPISLLSPIAKTLEKIILPNITDNIPNTTHQHGFKKHHSTSTALHSITNSIAKGFNQKKPPSRTILVSLDMSKAFDSVNIHKLTDKILQTNIPTNIIKFTANYIKGRKAYTQYNNTSSKQKLLKTGVPQGGVLSPTLFNIYTSDIPSPPKNVQLDT